MPKTAFITGITGQDGAYLTQFLLEKDYEVHGLVRRFTPDATWRLDHLLGNGWQDQNLTLHLGDMTDGVHLHHLITQLQPDEIYNLAGQTYVWDSFQRPLYTGDVDALGPLRLLESIRAQDKQMKIYQASTSEIFGNSSTTNQDERTPMNPVSPYGAAKLYAFNLTRQYRENYGVFAANGILFNHESPLRDPGFVTRKIVQGLVAIKKGRQAHLKLGNLQAKRDWGHAKDYVRGMWQMLQQDTPDDFVLATGETRSVADFLFLACTHLSLDAKDVVSVDPALLRPKDIDVLCGNAQKANDILGWQPKISFEDLVEDMIEYEMTQQSI